MCKPCIGVGLHCVTVDEIHMAAIEKRDRHAVFGDRMHASGFWPHDKSNRELRAALCDGCSFDSCVNWDHCRWAQEAKRRVLSGEMSPCFGLSKLFESEEAAV